MDTIRLDTGIKKINIEIVNGDNVELIFNPNDAALVQELHGFYRNMTEKAKEIEGLEDEHGAPQLDENGVPTEITPVIEKSNLLNQWIRSEIDKLFGDGISQKIYGDTMYYGEMLLVYFELIMGLMQFADTARAKKVKAYVRKK